MPTPTPQILLPYLSDLAPGSLHLISSVLNAPANWLVVRFISAALRESQNVEPLEHGSDTQSSVARCVIFLSLLRPLSLWVEIGKKAGIDLPSLLANRRLLYIDGTDIYGRSTSLTATKGESLLKSHALDDVRNAIQRATTTSHDISPRRSSEVVGTETETTLFVDGIDFLIASQPELTAAKVSQMLTDLRQQVHSTILTVSSDSPLLHSDPAPATPLETQHKALVASLAHESRLVIQLRGLDTGTAKDVSGVIRISHGGGYEEEVEEQDMPEGEWLYKVSGDGSVKVWGRGG